MLYAADVLLAELNNERPTPKNTSALLVGPSAKDGTDEIDDILKGLEISGKSKTKVLSMYFLANDQI
jgi:hypothetical protein